MARKSKAPESALAHLHNLVTEDLIDRIGGEHTPQDIRAAIDWLKANGITGVAADETPLGSLSSLIEGLTFEEVEAKL